MATAPVKMEYFVNNRFVESKTEHYMECFDPSTGEATRVGRKLNDKNKLVRYAKKSGEEIK